MRPPPHNIVPVAVLFELMLGLLGAALARWWDVPLKESLMPEVDPVIRGVAGATPMLAILVLLTYSNWPPVVDLRRQVESIVEQLFGAARWWELALVAAAAGLGAESLFRGALQPIVAGWTTPAIGLVVVSLLFGLLHAASTAYFFLATSIGAYLGWMTQQYDDLVAPIITHAFYDFVALVWLQRRIEA